MNNPIHEIIEEANAYYARYGAPMERRWVDKRRLNAVIDAAHKMQLFCTATGDPIGRNNRLAIEELRRRALNGEEIVYVYGVQLRLIEVLPPEPGRQERSRRAGKTWEYRH